MSHLDHLRYAIPDIDVSHVVDVGSGAGGFLLECARAGIDAHGIEYNREHIARAEDRARVAHLTITVTQGVAEQLPCADASATFVNVSEVLEHVQDPRRAVAEIARILAPRGSAYLTVSNRFGIINPHFHLWGINWIPRPLAEKIISLLQRDKDYHGVARKA